MVADEAPQTVVLFGGDGGIPDHRMRDTWVWTGGSWSRYGSSTSSTAPPDDAGTAMAYDEDDQTIVFFGGPGKPLASTAGSSPSSTYTFLDATSVSLSVAPMTIPSDGASTACATARVTLADGTPAKGDGVTITANPPPGSTRPMTVGVPTNGGDGTYSATVTASPSGAVDVETLAASTDREVAHGTALIAEAAPAPGAQPVRGGCGMTLTTTSTSSSSTPTPTPTPSPTPTGGGSSGCPQVTAGPGQVEYPRGYSLIGLPTGTRIHADSPVYSWSDRGAGGTYSVQDPDAPLSGHVGYLAWFRCPTVVTASGPGSSSLDVPLGAYHASMIGNPSATGPVTVSGFDYAARWDPTARQYTFSHYREPETLAVGEAVWVFAFVDATVHINP